MSTLYTTAVLQTAPTTAFSTSNPAKTSCYLAILAPASPNPDQPGDSRPQRCFVVVSDDVHPTHSALTNRHVHLSGFWFPMSGSDYDIVLLARLVKPAGNAWIERPIGALFKIKAQVVEVDNEADIIVVCGAIKHQHTVTGIYYPYSHPALCSFKRGQTLEFVGLFLARHFVPWSVEDMMLLRPQVIIRDGGPSFVPV